MDATDHERLIVRYLNGDYSKEDRQNLIDWINERPENKELFLGIKDIWDASLKKSNTETQQLLQFYKKQASRKKKVHMPGWFSGVAAAAVLVIGLVIGSLIQYGGHESMGQIESFYVPMGSRSRVTLTDGTTVSLNSNSRMELDDGFSGTNRIVSLQGEGYFEVKADKNNPFTVKTDNFNITVTGTRFNVSSYADDQKISATLAEGRVQLATKNSKTIVLKPGEKITFDQKTMQPVLEQADVESELAWVEGEFIFKEIPFPDLIRKLERWYDVRLLYKGNDFNSMMYSGRFKNQETIWQVLDALKLTTPIDYKKTDFREFELIYKPM
ncbi:MAG: FecR domain-containing protein [Bacteroidales bacterium]